METLQDRVKALAGAVDWPPVIAAAEGLAVIVLLAALLLAPGGPRLVEAPPVGLPAQAAAAAAPGASPEAAAPKPAPAKPVIAKNHETRTEVAQALKAPAPAAPKPPSEPAPPPPAPVSAPPVAVAAADLPDTGADYRKARRALLNKGFKPARVAPPECRGPEPSVDACWGALVEYPEIESCQGQNGASCVGWWVAPDGRVLNIRTGGGQPRITGRHWASPGEIDELPRGWKP